MSQKTIEIERGLLREGSFVLEVKDENYWRPMPFGDMADPSWSNLHGKYKIVIEFTPEEAK